MLYVIGDLHLGIGINKSMDIFGANWINHTKKINKNISKLSEDDTLLILGDISWANNIDEAKEDLLFLQKFNCKKILMQGNHDFWWSSIKKLNENFNMKFIKHGYFVYEEYAICIAKGSICPGDEKFDEHSQKLYTREYNRLEYSLKKAKDDGYKKLIVSLHYPPTSYNKEKTKYIEIIEKYNVEIVLYAHLHGEENFNCSLIGEYNNIKYDLVSGDYLNFEPKQIL